MRKIILSTGFVVLGMNLLHSAITVVRYATCERDKMKNRTTTPFFLECNQVQPWILNLAVCAYLIHFVLGSSAIVGLARIKGNLMAPWMLSELILMTYKCVEVEFYGFFYPIYTYNLEFDLFDFQKVFMEMFLGLFAELLAWFLVCGAHEQMYVRRKAHRKKQAKVSPRVQQLRNKYLYPLEY